MMPDRLSRSAGLGFRAPHRDVFLAGAADVRWIEVHAENYLCAGGARLAELDGARAHYEVSLHGVGLSLGSAEGLDRAHLSGIRALIERCAPAMVSEHVAWCAAGGVYFSDLLPIPYSEEALDVVARNVAQAQDAFGREILIENPSTYVAFADSVIPEAEFIAEIARRTGCGLLLDINNIYVSTQNNGGSPLAYLESVPAARVSEIHLAGHARMTVEGEDVLIDDHGSCVDPAVWALYESALALMGSRATLIEWDSNIPPFGVLAGEAALAQARLDKDVPAVAEPCHAR